MTPIKSCPFCGAEAESCHTGVWWLRCVDDECGAEGPVRDSEDEAVAAWNRRLTDGEAADA